MEIALIAPYSDITSFGIRTLVSIVRKHGHSVTLIILNDSDSETSPKPDYQYPQLLLEQIYAAVTRADLIGMSLMTLYYDRMVQLTQFLRNNLATPIVWGGIHPTIRPEECLQWADGVALGEADLSLPALLDNLEQGFDFTTTPGFWFKKEDVLIKNPLPAPVVDLDDIPFPDYFPEKQFFLGPEKDTLVEVDSGLLKKAFTHNPIWKMGTHIYYQTMASRGCPYNCSYCCNNALRKLYGGDWQVRHRSPEHLVTELHYARETFSFITAVVLSDDSFFAYPLDQLKHFAQLYHERVGLPFRCLTSPLTLTREKLETLLDCGLFSVQMGIQTGSERTKKLYRRSIATTKILDAAQLLAEYKHRMEPPLYDFILDNPFETIADCLATVKLVRKLPRPYFLQLFSLVLFPGTELAEKAKEQIGPHLLEGYHRPFNAYSSSYCNILLLMYHHGVPLGLVGALSWRPLVYLLSIPPFHQLIAGTYWIFKRVKALVSHLLGKKQ
ncbi:B12-binding domain-containing radical SAM protein [bacterium]|nr:B12-binding domain-containing radical SAM protein [bacterium]